ncbi:putative FBD-associated F-box protein At5g56820 [Trifolium pratense]|nr:putative FBD-associated F-box protein At5g56820 isoform X1 [Trifolium pratense]XP_045819171.1 putative FBD-associated F-box protein At5g56820 [Trifolium pratense]
MENSPPIDRISNLPDELLCHILSFLPIQFAITTTLLLSKRWTPLFKSFTSLHFYYQSSTFNVDVDAFNRYREFVHTVTLTTQFIINFHLHCCSTHWHIFPESLLPSTILRSPTLRVLKLNNINVLGNISVDLPSLKTLHLTGVCFKNQENFHKLLFRCPVLEDLKTIIYYTKRFRHCTTISITKDFKILSKLITADVCQFKFPMMAIRNVRFLVLHISVGLHVGDINFECPVFQNLIQLQLHIRNFQNWDDVVELLQCCPKLQTLTIHKSAMNNNLSINWRDPNPVPECISSHLRSCTINYEGWKDELKFTKYILQNARLLEVMKIKHKHKKPCLEELASCPMISSECELLVTSFFDT